MSVNRMDSKILKWKIFKVTEYNIFRWADDKEVSFFKGFRCVHNGWLAGSIQRREIQKSSQMEMKEMLVFTMHAEFKESYLVLKSSLKFPYIGYPSVILTS